VVMGDGQWGCEWAVVVMVMFSGSYVWWAVGWMLVGGWVGVVRSFGRNGPLMYTCDTYTHTYTPHETHLGAQRKRRPSWRRQRRRRRAVLVEVGVVVEGARVRRGRGLGRVGS
jgi:hypothetical protein